MMKKLLKQIGAVGLMLMMLSPAVLAERLIVIPGPPEEGYVQDEAKILSEETESIINEQLALLESETSTQIVVVSMFDLQDQPIESMALDIGREWGVGQEEFDNGLVFLIAPNERQVRIEVGRGLEGVITDANSSLILNQVVMPHYKEGDYDTGTLEGLSYLEGLARDEAFDLSELESINFEGSPGDIFAFIATFGIFFIWLALSFMSQSKSWWAGGVFGAIIGGILSASIIGAVILGLLGLGLDYIASTYFYKKIKMGGGAGSGGSSGGGFSGGSSGGGASGSW